MLRMGGGGAHAWTRVDEQADGDHKHEQANQAGEWG